MKNLENHVTFLTETFSKGMSLIIPNKHYVNKSATSGKIEKKVLAVNLSTDCSQNKTENNKTKVLFKKNINKHGPIYTQN